MSSKANGHGPVPIRAATTSAPVATPPASAANNGFPPPSPAPAATHHHTPATRIEDLRNLITTGQFPELRADLEALIRYYENGGRCPQGEEELLVVNGQLYWGTCWGPNNTPEGTYKTPKYKEVGQLLQLVVVAIVEMNHLL